MREKRNVRVAWLGCLLTGVSFSMVIPYMTLLIGQLGVAASTISYYTSVSVSLTAFSTIIMAPVWGVLADRIGRKPLMILASLSVCLIMLGISAVQGIYSFLFLRFLTGVLQGYVPYATALVATDFTKETRKRQLGFLATGLTAGNFIGPFVGGALGDLLGIREIFLFSSLIAGICWLLTATLIKEQKVNVVKRESVQLVKVIKLMPNKSYLSRVMTVTFVMRVVTMSINPIVLLFMKQLNPSIIGNLVFSGTIISILHLSSIISAPAINRLADYLTSKQMLIIGLLLQVISLFTLAVITNLTQLSLVYVLMGVAQQMITPAIHASITEHAPESIRSSILSLNFMAQNAGQVIGPILGAALVSRFNFSVLFVLLASTVIAATVLLSQKISLTGRIRAIAK